MEAAVKPSAGSLPCRTAAHFYAVLPVIPILGGPDRQSQKLLMLRKYASENFSH
jgi:hypothetical protein